jgi:hypothetical protein
MIANQMLYKESRNSKARRLDRDGIGYLATWHDIRAETRNDIYLTLSLEAGRINLVYRIIAAIGVSGQIVVYERRQGGALARKGMHNVCPS